VHGREYFKKNPVVLRAVSETVTKVATITTTATTKVEMEEVQRAVQVLAGYPGVAAIERAIGGLVEAANREGKSQGVVTIMSLSLNYLEPLKKYLNTTLIKG
jgi:transcription elongation factor